MYGAREYRYFLFHCRYSLPAGCARRGSLAVFSRPARSARPAKTAGEAPSHQRKLKKNITKYNKAQCNVNARVTPKPQNAMQQRNAIPEPQRKTAVYRSGTSGLLSQASCLPLFLAFFEPGALFFKRDASSFADAIVRLVCKRFKIHQRDGGIEAAAPKRIAQADIESPGIVLRQTIVTVAKLSPTSNAPSAAIPQRNGSSHRARSGGRARRMDCPHGYEPYLYSFFLLKYPNSSSNGRMPGAPMR